MTACLEACLPRPIHTPFHAINSSAVRYVTSRPPAAGASLTTRRLVWLVRTKKSVVVLSVVYGTCPCAWAHHRMTGPSHESALAHHESSEPRERADACRERRGHHCRPALQSRLQHLPQCHATIGLAAAWFTLQDGSSAAFARRGAP